MAVRWGTYQVSFVGGVETKAAEKAVGGDRDSQDKQIIAKLLRADNATFVRPGEIAKRPVNTAVDLTVQASMANKSALADQPTAFPRTDDFLRCRGLFHHGNQLIALDGNRLRTYKDGSGWTDQGPLSALRLSQQTVTNTKTHSVTDNSGAGRIFGAKNGIQAVAVTWGDTSPVTSFVRVIDEATGRVIREQQIGSAGNSSAPQACVTVGDKLLFIYPAVGAVGVDILPIDTTDPYTAQTAYTAADAGSQVASSLAAAVHTNGTTVIVPYCYDTTPEIRCILFNGSTEAFISDTQLSTVCNAKSSLGVCVTVNGYVFFFWDNTNGAGHEIYMHVRSGSTLSTVDRAPVAIVSNASTTTTPYAHFPCIEDPATEDEVIFAYGLREPDDGTSTDIRTVMTAHRVDTSGTLNSDLGTEKWVFGLTPVSQPWVYLDTVYFIAQYQASRAATTGYASGGFWQPTYFLVALRTYGAELEFSIQGRFLESDASRMACPSGHQSGYQVPLHSVVQDGAQVRFVVKNYGALSTEEGTVSAQTTAISSISELVEQVVLVCVDHEAEIEAVEFGGSLFIAAGCLFEWDGQYIIEAGFHIGPDDLTLAVAGGGSLSVGVYNVAACYAWTAGNGRTYRSPISQVESITLGAGDDEISVKVVPFNLTNRPPPQQNAPWVYLEVYLSESVGSEILRLHTKLLITTDTGATPDLLEFPISLKTLPSSTARLLYNTAGVVENQPPPAPCSLAVRNRRLYLAGIDGTVRYTKELQPGEGAALFSDAFNKALDNQRPQLFHIAEMDGAIYAFTAAGIAAFTGPGPDDTGVGQFSDWQLVIYGAAGFDGGLVAPLPVTAERGIWFFQGGMAKVLMRNNQVVDIGLSMQNLATLTECSRIVYRDTYKQIWYFVVSDTGDNMAYVFDTVIEQWSCFRFEDSLPPGGAIEAGGAFYRGARDVALVWVES